MKRFLNKKRITALIAALGLALLLPLTALAAVPSRPGNQYVLDSAGVLSDQLEQEIVRKNKELFKDTGAEIAVAAVDFLGGREIDDYAYDLFASWGVGSQERNNGLLLVLAIAEDDYYALPGYGIEDTFSGSYLQTMLDDYLETDFAAGDYEGGVRKFFDAAYSELSAYSYDDAYDETDDFYQGGGYQDWSDEYDEGASLSSGFFSSIVQFIILIVVVVLVLCVVIALLRAVSRPRTGQPPYQNYNGVPQYPRRDNFWAGMFLGRALGRRQRRNWGAPPPPPPPPPPGSGFNGFHSGGPMNRPGSFHSCGSAHRPSGGFHRPSGGGFSRGGGSRGGGAGRRK